MVFDPKRRRLVEPMRRSTSLTIRDIRAVDRVVFEARELGHDPERWQQHVLGRMSEIIHLPVGLLCEIDTLDPDRDVTVLHAAEHGWPSEKLRLSFIAANEPGGPKPFSISPVDVRFRDDFARRRGSTRTREDLIDRAAWHDSRAYVDFHKPAEMDEMLCSAVRLPQRRSVSFLAFGGREHRPGARERKMVALLHHQLSPHFGRRLITHREPGRHRLRPRQREVFDLLCDGLDEKEIAARLHRSRATVAEHVSAIYRSFAVRSRAQFMASLLRSLREQG